VRRRGLGLGFGAGGGEEEDRGRRGDEETRWQGLHVHLLTRDEGEPEVSHRHWRRQGLAEEEERGEEVRRRRGGDWD
jgi:hypothetical protein